jgi:hypothetical protein
MLIFISSQTLRRNSMKIFKVFPLLSLVFLFGCSGLQVALEHQDLEIVTSTDSIIFLDNFSKDKTVAVQVINASQHDDMDNLKSEVEDKLTSKGITVIQDPKEADFVIQARIGNANQQKKSAREVKGGRGEHGALLAGTAGGFAGATSGGSGAAVLAGAVGGAVVGGAADLTVNSWVKMGYITILTEIQIIEKTDTPVETVQVNQVSQGGGSGEAMITQTQTRMENALKYRMRAVSRASQVNMEWEDCSLAFHKEIVNVLSNIM